MAKAFDNFIAALSGTKDGVLPSAQTFPPVDVQQMERDLRNIAEQRSSAVTDLDIRAALEFHARKAEDAFRSQLALYDARIRGARVISSHAVEIHAEGENALATFKVQTVDEQNRLHQVQEQVSEHDAELRRFRSKHGLTRPARIVTSNRQHFGVALVVLFAVAETMINGAFFAQGSDLGWIGGIVEAAVLATINVGVAALISSFWLPYLRHRSVPFKVLGICGLLVYFFWTIAFNLAVAHYRDLFATSSGQVSPSEWIRLLTSEPLVLTSMQSWILGLLGVAFSVATAIDVSGLKDGYPGYGWQARERRLALENYVQDVSESLSGFQNTRDDAVTGMSNVVKSIREAQYDLELAISGRARLLDNLRAYFDHLRLVNRQLTAQHSAGIASDFSWLMTPETLPPPPYAANDTEVVAQKMESLISQVNAHYVAAANQLASARSALQKSSP